MFDLSQLRCFVTVAEELHFGRAAARLNMTQPLSRQIQVLEHIVEASLLDRTSRSVRLTPAGRSFLPEARRILKLAESASQVARRIAQGKTGSIKIGFTVTSAYGFMPDLVAACRTQLSEIDLSLKEMVTGDQLEALVSGQIDIGLLRPPIGRPEFASMRVVAERLLVAFPQGHAFSDRDVVAPRELDGQPFIMYSPHESRYFHDLVVTLFTRAGGAAAIRSAPQPGPFHSRHGVRRPWDCHCAGSRDQAEFQGRGATAFAIAGRRAGRDLSGLAPRRRKPAAGIADRDRGWSGIRAGKAGLMRFQHWSIQ